MENKEKCDGCGAIVTKTYGFNVNGQYKALCSSCGSKRK